MSDTPPPADGWQQGPDGKWYGPGQELPAAPASEELPTAPPAPPRPEGEPDTEGHGASSDDATGGGQRRLMLIGGAVLAIAVVGALVLVSLGGDDGPTMTGQFTLSDTESISGTAESCRGTGGYSDFGPGMNVTIRNGSGEIVASGNTSSLDAEEQYGSDSDAAEQEEPEGDEEPMSPQELADAMFDFLGCTVVFEVDVPTEDFYAIEVGRRGELSYSRQELEEKDWNVSLTLGD